MLKFENPTDMLYILLPITIITSIVVVIYYVKKTYKIKAIYKKYNVKAKEELLDKCGLKTMAEIIRYDWDWEENCHFHAILKFTPVNSSSPIFVCHYFKQVFVQKQPVEERYPVGSQVEIVYCPDYPKIYRTTIEFSNKLD